MTRWIIAGAAALLLVACTEKDRAVQPGYMVQYPTLKQLKMQLDTGSVSSEQVVAELLARAARHANLNAYITLNEDALELARVRDRQRAKGQILGPLHGLPVVVKDNIHVAGMPNTAGTPALKSFAPEVSNQTVQALQRAGAIILGKTNLHELAFGITSDNVAFGAVANPVARDHFAGGSSGGTAAAIAAGLAPAGLGSDTGGSARIPAALTGIAGFRPSPGRYPSEAVTPISRTRDTVGTLAHSVADLALLDGVITGRTTLVASPAPGRIRLGVVRDYYFAGLEQATADVIEKVLKRLQAEGVTLVEISYPALSQQVGAGFPIALYEARRDLTDYLQRYNTGITLDQLASQVASPDVQGAFGAIVGPGAIPLAAYEAALEDVAAMKADFSRLFTAHQLDAIAFPTTPLTARPIANSRQTVDLDGHQVPTFPTYIRNTDPASLAGLPGISLPAGLASNGLPVGLEIDGAAGNDEHLLAVAGVLERLLQGDQ